MSLGDTVSDASGALLRRLRHRSLVTRDPQFVIWFRRAILQRRPVLFRFEVQLTDHCNLNCKGCRTFSNLCPPAFADLAVFESDMGHMARIFSRVRQIHLIGGEPLLHPKVGEFCRVARTAFPKSRIYLRTNGTLVVGASEEFWNALAESKVILLCDPYPINLPVIEINLLAKAHHVRIEWADLKDELFKTPIDPRADHDAASSFSRCQGYANRPLLRDGRLYPCANVAFADVFRERFSIADLKVYPTDWIGIRDDPDPEHVFAFLRNPVHWCSHCDMDNRTSFEWAPSNRHISEWTSAPPPASRPAGTSATHIPAPPSAGG